MKPVDLWTAEDVQQLETSELVICLSSPSVLLGTPFDRMKSLQQRNLGDFDMETRKRTEDTVDRVLEWARAELNRRVPRNNPFLPPLESPHKVYPRWTDPNATASEIRESIIGAAGASPAFARLAYDAALAREGKIDSPDGPIYPPGHSSAGERLSPEQVVALARNVINRYSLSSDKTSVQLALRVINGAHERDRLRDALGEALDRWESFVTDQYGDDSDRLDDINKLRKLLEAR